MHTNPTKDATITDVLLVKAIDFAEGLQERIKELESELHEQRLRNRELRVQLERIKCAVNPSVKEQLDEQCEQPQKAHGPRKYMSPWTAESDKPPKGYCPNCGTVVA